MLSTSGEIDPKIYFQFSIDNMEFIYIYLFGVAFCILSVVRERLLLFENILIAKAIVSNTNGTQMICIALANRISLDKSIFITVRLIPHRFTNPHIHLTVMSARDHESTTHSFVNDSSWILTVSTPSDINKYRVVDIISHKHDSYDNEMFYTNRKIVWKQYEIRYLFYRHNKTVIIYHNNNVWINCVLFFAFQANEISTFQQRTIKYPYVVTITNTKVINIPLSHFCIMLIWGLTD